MKTEYEHIRFVKIDGTLWWRCHSNGTKDQLGIIEWYSNRKRYEFSGTKNEGHCPSFTTDCLRDIADFMGQLKELK